MVSISVYVYPEYTKLSVPVDCDFQGNELMQSEIPASTTKPKRFFAWSVLNRDLCQLEFFRRVLEEATDKTTPVLEKLKFLSVFSSNLDEFFMVRVSGIKEMLGIEDIGPMPGELTPVEQLRVIRKRVLEARSRADALSSRRSASRARVSTV